VKKQDVKNILSLNLAMLCISTSGALGRYINLAPPLTIWYRAFFAMIFLGVFCIWIKNSFKVDIKKDGWVLLLTGILMAGHLVFYFYALQWSNVAIGMLSLFTYPMMTAFLEPIFFKPKFEKVHLVLGALILIGIYFIAPSFEISNTATLGLCMGLLSALCYSIRNIIVKSKIKNFNGSILMFYQMVVVFILLFPVLFIYNQQNVVSQIPFLIFLGLITTAVGHTLFLNSFKNFKVSTASIMSSIQPVFGIILAMIFLHEIPDSKSIIGGLLILSTVIIEARRTASENDK